jgi:putative spermidine/putrescine transport system ATP-binding protein
MADPLVTMRGVRKSYDGASDAVAPLDLDIARGEFLTLLGPSGSGKTTTLMMLAGFEDPSAGRIVIDGRDMAGVPPHRRGLGVVFQSYALFPHMSVAENVGFPLSVRGVSRGRRATQVAEALAMVRLEGFGARRPAELSGGQQQRVALARALVFRPAIVLMDEPLGALDRALREEMQAEIRALHASLGVTVVYVTHDQGEALAMSDRIAVFHQGRLRQVASPRALYDAPADPFVAGFVGENNFLPATVLGVGDDRVRLRLEGGAEVDAVPSAALPPGARAVVAIRPERIALAPVRAADLGADALPARVVDSVFLGDALRVSVQLAGGQRITVRRPIAAALPLPQGSEVALAWTAEHARAFPAG